MLNNKVEVGRKEMDKKLTIEELPPGQRLESDVFAILAMLVTNAESTMD